MSRDNGQISVSRCTGGFNQFGDAASDWVFRGCLTSKKARKNASKSRIFCHYLDRHCWYRRRMARPLTIGLTRPPTRKGANDHCIAQGSTVRRAQAEHRGIQRHARGEIPASLCCKSHAARGRQLARRAVAVRWPLTANRLTHDRLSARDADGHRQPRSLVARAPDLHDVFLNNAGASRSLARARRPLPLCQETTGCG